MMGGNASVMPAPSNRVTIHVPADHAAAPASQQSVQVSTALTDVGLPKLTFAASTAPPASIPVSDPGSVTVAAPSAAAAAAPHNVPLTPTTPMRDAPKASSSPFGAELLRQKTILPAVPNVTITFQDLSVSVPIPVIDPGFETIGSKLWNAATFAGFRNKGKTRQFDRLAGATGVIRPGTLTLLQAPPGHGKSTLLKALAGREPATAGSVRFNGLTQAEALEAGVHVSKLVQYIDQVDVHNPLLTVQETFQFAVDNFSVDPNTLPDAKSNPELKKLHDEKADKMIELLGLGECRNTILGNSLLRGVSGGQKKRVTVGEALLSEARVYCMDEVTNGLDSSTALDIFKALRDWAQVTGGAIVAALQQPTPELVACFDQLIMLREGKVVYNGSTVQSIPYLESLGYHCPADTDLADYQMQFLTHPKFVLALQQQRSGAGGAGTAVNAASKVALDAKYAPTDTVTPGPGHHEVGVELSPIRTPVDVPGGAAIPTTTDELVHAWTSTAAAKDIQAQIEGLEASAKSTSVRESVLLNGYCRALYGSQYTHSFWYHLASNVKRQRELNSRNKGLTGPRVGQAVVMSLLLGSLFYDTGLTQFPERIALILFALTFVAFGNMSEVPIAVEAKRVLYKQADAGLFPITVYVIGVILCHLPLLLIETTIFSIILYFLTSFTTTASSFFIFWIIMICSGLAMSVWFRMLAYVAPNEEIAQAMAGPSTGIFMLFGGFFITYSSVPSFMTWLYWLSPFSWSVRSLAVNEFTQNRYKEYQAVINGQPAVVNIGQLYLDTYEMRSGSQWIWNGPLLLIGYFIALSVLSIVVLTYKRYELSRGTKRFEEVESGHSNGAHKNSVVLAQPNGAADGGHASAAASALPFTAVTLSFSKIHYTIVDDQGQTKKLLTDVSGYAKPKTLTALMGVSGAGKTTLMDVIAGRKTQGKIEGDILVNGKKVSPTLFARLSGYVEQEDIHTPTATVRETLLFAARLRLPESVPDSAKVQFVDEILELLELSDVANALIGNAVILGLAPGQLKRVTIGVELVSNPPILFLDEPTTGLDSRSAYTVMRVIRKIAASGRSVVVTIHQPSAELFYFFDALLLLAPGGVQTYFGEIGHRGRSLVEYFEALGAPRKPRRMNPASWMLDVIGAGTGAHDVPSVAIDVKQNGDGKPSAAVSNKLKVDFGAAYHASPLFSHCEEQLQLITRGAGAAAAGGSGEPELSRYATGILTQFYYYMIRLVLSYWRNIPFIWNRGVVMLVISIVFGLVYFDLKVDTQGGVLSKISVMFVTGGFAGIIHSATCLPVLVDQRAVYYRERSSNMYSSIVYSISILIAEIPTIAILNLMFLSILYFMVGLDSSPELFFRFYLAHITLSVCYSSMAQFLAAVMPNKLVAGIIQGIYFSNFFLFGGMLVNGNNVPAGWKWMWHWTPIHHALESLVMPQFEKVTQQIIIVTGAVGAPTPINEYVSQYLAFPYGNYWTPLGWLLLFIVVVRLLIILAMEKVSFIKR